MMLDKVCFFLFVKLGFHVWFVPVFLLLLFSWYKMSLSFFCHARSIWVCMLFVEAAYLLTEDPAVTASFAYVTCPKVSFGSQNLPAYFVRFWLYYLFFSFSCWTFFLIIRGWLPLQFLHLGSLVHSLLSWPSSLHTWHATALQHLSMWWPYLWHLKQRRGWVMQCDTGSLRYPALTVFGRLCFINARMKVFVGYLFAVFEGGASCNFCDALAWKFFLQVVIRHVPEIRAAHDSLLYA